MEKLKAEIPEKLKRMVAESGVEDISFVCLSVHDFFLQSTLFHQMIDDLTNPEHALCGKNKASALDLKRRGNDCFSARDYYGALNFYSQALRVAPIDAIEKQKILVATLYVNRASTLHKMGFVLECLRDCDRAIKICPTYVKAWFRRGKANSSMQNYLEAERDLMVAIEMEQSQSAKKQVSSEMELIRQCSAKSSYSHLEENKQNLSVHDEYPEVKIHCIRTSTKGRGMTSLCDIPAGSLVHNEEPYALIILKNFRETHCHFCLNKLPLNTVPCHSCSVPLYCSEKCQNQAGSGQSSKHVLDRTIKALSSDLEKHVLEITLSHDSDHNVQSYAEHEHECHGFHWPLVLPSDVVLAGRILVKSMKHRAHSTDALKDLSHNYGFLPLESKLESIVYSIVLLYCLRLSYDSTLEHCGASISRVVHLICQIRVNSMAVVRIKSQENGSVLDITENSCSNADATTCNIEQVRVGQAIYLSGSMFNHSCQPNIHAYFLSRSLLIRSTDYLAKGSHLELSYGPQVGHWDCGRRQQFLEEKYSFRCQCSGCSELNLPDLLVNSFHCAKLKCSGVVMDSSVMEYEKRKLNHLRSGLVNPCLKFKFQVEEMRKVASRVFEQSNNSLDIEPGCCLTCGLSHDINVLNTTVKKAEECIGSLQQEVNSSEVYHATALEAVGSINILKSTCHPYSYRIAEAEDLIAKAFCLVGEMKLAAEHCVQSIKILKKLYSPNHIAVGNELVKLASLQASLGDSSVTYTVHELGAIFSLYYGPHAEVIFPYLDYLKKNASKLASQEPT